MVWVFVLDWDDEGVNLSSGVSWRYLWAHEYSHIVVFVLVELVLDVVGSKDLVLGDSMVPLKIPESSNATSDSNRPPSNTSSLIISSRLLLLVGLPSKGVKSDLVVGLGLPNKGVKSPPVVVERCGGDWAGLIGLVLPFSGVGVSFRNGPPRLGISGSNVHGERRGRAKNCLFFV